MSQKRILIVDDEDSFTRLLKLNLEAGGAYKVMAVNAAEEAVATALAFKPDLIFLDVMMPGMDGGEVAARLQTKPALSKVPIVSLTAAAKKDEVGSRGGLIGGLPYLAKPVDAEVVIACIRKHLGR